MPNSQCCLVQSRKICCRFGCDQSHTTDQKKSHNDHFPKRVLGVLYKRPRLPRTLLLFGRNELSTSEETRTNGRWEWWGKTRWFHLLCSTCYRKQLREGEGTRKKVGVQRSPVMMGATFIDHLLGRKWKESLLSSASSRKTKLTTEEAAEDYVFTHPF